MVILHISANIEAMRKSKKLHQEAWGDSFCGNHYIFISGFDLTLKDVSGFNFHKITGLSHVRNSAVRDELTRGLGE